MNSGDQNNAGTSDSADTAMTPEQAEPLPALASRDEATVATVAAIAAEVRSTAGAASQDEVAGMLRRRLSEEGIRLADTDVTELARQLVEGETS